MFKGIPWNTVPKAEVKTTLMFPQPQATENNQDNFNSEEYDAVIKKNEVDLKMLAEESVKTKGRKEKKTHTLDHSKWICLLAS